MTIEEYAMEVDLQDQLQQSKAQERKVRQLTMEILNPQPVQQTLF